MHVYDALKLIKTVNLCQGGYSPFLWAAMKNKVGAMKVLADCKGNFVNDVTEVSRSSFYQIPLETLISNCFSNPLYQSTIDLLEVFEMCITFAIKLVSVSLSKKPPKFVMD